MIKMPLNTSTLSSTTHLFIPYPLSLPSLCRQSTKGRRGATAQRRLRRGGGRSGGDAAALAWRRGGPPLAAAVVAQRWLWEVTLAQWWGGPPMPAVEGRRWLGDEDHRCLLWRGARMHLCYELATHGVWLELARSCLCRLHHNPRARCSPTVRRKLQHLADL